MADKDRLTVFSHGLSDQYSKISKFILGFFFSPPYSSSLFFVGSLQLRYSPPDSSCLVPSTEVGFLGK